MTTRKPGRPATGKPTLKAIAERTGHGLMTVSRALGPQAHLVTAAKRADILRAAAELGYRPDLNVRALRRGTGTLVGLLVEHLDDRAHALLVSLHDALVPRGLLPCLVVIRHHPGHDGLSPAAAAVRHLVERRVAGVVAVHATTAAEPSWAAPLRADIVDRGLPAVAVAPAHDVPGITTLRPPLLRVAQAVATQLSAQGVRDAHVLPPSADDGWQHAWATAYRSAATALGIALHEHPIAGGALFAPHETALGAHLAHAGPLVRPTAYDPSWQCLPGHVLDGGDADLGRQAATWLLAQWGIGAATSPV